MAEADIRPAATPTFSYSSSLVTLAKADGPQAEAIRALRSHVMSSHVEKGRRALAVCAVTEGVGCSYVAANLAVSLAQVGVKTLLIDADLRNSSIPQFIARSGSGEGLSDYLGSDEGQIGQYICHDVLPNLSVMFGGQPHNNTHELLAGDQFKALLDHCMRNFEITIIDTPAANASADVRTVCNGAGYALVVAKENQSRIADIKMLISQLQSDGAVVVGTVLSED